VRKPGGACGGWCSGGVGRGGGEEKAWWNLDLAVGRPVGAHAGVAFVAVGAGHVGAVGLWAFGGGSDSLKGLFLGRPVGRRAAGVGAIEGAHGPGHVGVHAASFVVQAGDVALWNRTVEQAPFDTDTAEVDFVLVVDVTRFGLERRHKSRSNRVRTAFRPLRRRDPERPQRGHRWLLQRREATVAGCDGHDHLRDQDYQDSQDSVAYEVECNVEQLLHRILLPFSRVYGITAAAWPGARSTAILISNI
jgi:hypothetical protein